MSRVEPLPRQRGDELDGNEPRRPRLTFAQREQSTAQAPPGPIRVNEERADPRGIRVRAEQSRLALRVRIAAEQRGATTPAATQDQRVPDFSDEIRPVSNDLGIDTPDPEESSVMGLPRLSRDSLAILNPRHHYRCGADPHIARVATGDPCFVDGPPSLVGRAASSSFRVIDTTCSLSVAASCG